MDCVLGILPLTEVRSYGYDKLCSNLHLPGVDFSLTAKCEHFKLADGSFEKDPIIRPSRPVKTAFLRDLMYFFLPALVFG